MRSRMQFVLAACALLLGPAPLAWAGSGSLNASRFHSLPVLVTVNNHGKITNVQPAYEVPRTIKPLLKATLKHMITGPARAKGGKGIASQAIIELAVRATPRKDGKYTVSFKYIKAMPVPYSAWFWNHIDGHLLALENESVPPRYRNQRAYLYHSVADYWRAQTDLAAHSGVPRTAADGRSVRVVPVRHPRPVRALMPVQQSMTTQQAMPSTPSDSRSRLMPAGHPARHGGAR